MSLLAAGPSAAVAAEWPDAPLRDGNGATSAVPRPSVLMFWASWCAPCRAELRDLPQLSAAAPGIPLLVVATESNRQTRRMLGSLDFARVRYVGGDTLGFMRAWAGTAAGLPVAVAIDREGKRCSVKLGPLTVADLTVWRHACRWDVS